MADSEQAKYMREYRTTPGGIAQMRSQKRRDKARQLAYRSLARKHRVEFEVLFAKYLREVAEQARLTD